jgi:hypothetical protein
MPIDLINYLISRDVPEYLRLYCNGDRGVRTIGILVEAAKYICTNRLSFKLKMTARCEGVSDPGDLATSAIGELFGQNHSELPLVRALDGTIQSDRDLANRFISIVYVHVWRWLYHQLEHTDPQGFNVTRLARRTLHDRRLKAWPYDQPKFVCIANNSNLRQKAEPWKYNEILELCLRHYSCSANTSEWIMAIISEVNGTENKQAVIRVSMLMMACREASKQVSGQQFANQMPANHEDPGQTIDLSKVYALASEAVQKKIAWYYSNKKIDANTKVLLELAISDYLKDLLELVPLLSEFDYLKLHNAELAQTEYRRSLHSIFNELTKLARRIFGDSFS